MEYILLAKHENIKELYNVNKAEYQIPSNISLCVNVNVVGRVQNNINKDKKECYFCYLF